MDNVRRKTDRLEPEFPLFRIHNWSIHSGFCNICKSSLKRNGLLSLFGVKKCINKDCPNH